MSLSQSDPPDVSPRALVPSQLPSPSQPSHLVSLTSGEHWVGNQNPSLLPGSQQMEPENRKKLLCIIVAHLKPAGVRVP